MATLRLPDARCAWAVRVILATLFVVLLTCASSASSARAQTVVSLTFDDGTAAQVNAAAQLQARGLRGTFYINSANISSPDPYFMTWAQLDTIAAAGHEVAGHTLTHKRLTDLTAAQQRSEICDDAAALRARGYAITSFAYPFGAGSTQPGVLSALQDCGFVNARKVGELRDPASCPDASCPYAETLPPANPYGIRTSPLPAGAISLQNLKDWVTQVENNGGGWLPIVFHDLCDGCADSSVSTSDFTAFLDWLTARAAQGTVVKTMRQALAEGPQFPPPTTTIACNGGVCGTSNFKSPVSISFARADSGGGLGATRYTLDGTDPIPSSPEYTAPFTLTQTKTVKFRTWDLGGNPESVRTQVVNVDGTAPTASVSSPAHGSRVLTSGGPVTVSVTAADVGSSVADVQLLLDGDWFGSSSSTSSPYQFTLPGSLALGTHRLKAIATDAAGNQTTSAETTFTLSDGTPTTSIACNGAACPDTFVKGPLSVSLAATDGGGGVGATRYTLDGTDPTTGSTQYTAPFSVTSTKTVKFRTWNTAGQPEAVRMQLLKVDAVAPAASVTEPADGASIQAGGSVTVKVDAADPGSGIGDVQLFLDGDNVGSSSSTSSPYQFTVPASSLPLGTHRLKALAIDLAGNQTMSAQTTFTIKDGLPVTSIACNGGACSPDFVKGPVSVTLSAADGGTGLGVTRYTLDGSDPTTGSTQYTGAFTLTTSKTVKFRTWNSSGTPELVRTQDLKVDAVGPAAQITTPTEGASTMSGPLTVKVDATDAGAGMGDVQLFLDGDYAGFAGGTISPYQFTLGTLMLGTHRIKAIATDAIGNTTTTAQANFTIKDGLPVTSIACNGAACSTDWQKGPASVTLAAADGGSGLGVTRYTLDGSDPTTSSTQYTGAFTLTSSATVKFRTWNSSGQPETVKSQVLRIDAVAPTASITSPVDGANVKGDVTINVDATDAGSGMSDVELLLDGDWKAYTATAPYKFTLPAGELGLGPHRIKVVATDNLGNRTTTAQVNFHLKDGLPETTIACGGAACTTDWVKGPVSASLSATDGGAGLGATRYTLDGSDPTISSPLYTGPFTLTDTKTVKFRTWDSTGAAETVKSQLLRIDAVPPTTSITSPADGADVKGNVTVTVSASDAGSGMSEAELYLDGDWKAYSATAPYTFTLPAAELTLGAHRIKVIAYDNLGNSTPTAQVNFKLKDGLPETTIACGGAACTNDWVKGPVSVSLAATDGGGGLGATRYTLDGTDPSPSSPQYTGPFTLSTTATVKFRTWDLAGNPETVKSQLLKIDAVAPTASITSPANGSNLQGDVTINVDATDAGSGISEAELYLDGDWKAYTATVPLKFTLPASELALGPHRIKVIAYDNLGNSTPSSQVNFNFKDGLPETAIACDGAPCSPDWQKGPVSVSLSATNGGGGLGATRYTLDGTDPTTTSTEYTGPFTLSEATTVKFRTWDSTGAAETVKSQAIKLDAVAPTASITSPADGSNLQGDVTITVNATDAGSGMSEAELYLDGDWKAYSATAPYTFTLPASQLSLGAHRIKVVAYDNLGNKTPTAQVNFSLKDGLPETTIACNGAACSPDWQKGPVQVSLSATHSGGGTLGATRYTLDGTDPTPSSPLYTAPFTLTDATTVKFRTWDLAGNAELVRTQAIKLDAVAPTAAITSPTDGSNLQGDVTITLNAADAGSGMSEAELYLDGDWKAYSATAPYTFTLPASELSLGAHRIKVVAYDNLGNKTPTAQVNFNLKDGLPETAIACNGAACSADWQKGPVEVSLSATNSGAGGLGATRYTLDGTDPTPSSAEYTGPFTLTESKTIKFRTWDTTGVAESVKTQELKLDAVAPAGAITSPADNANLLRAQATTVTVDASDAGSGVTDVELLIDGDWFAASPSTSSPYAVTIPADALALGQHKLKAVITDALGNRSSSAITTINAKDGLPETAIACDGGVCPTDFVKGPVSVSLTATDGGGGLGATRYTLDGSDPDSSSQEYTGPFTLTDTTTVKFRTFDTSGAAESVKSQTIKIDATAPTAQLTSPTDATNLVGDVLVSANASDTGVGLADVELFLDGDFAAISGATSSPYEFTLAAGTIPLGTHRVKVIATDKLGNRTSSDTVTFTLTNGLPATTIACDGLACSSNWQKGPVEVTLAATESGSGVGATRYTLDGSDPDTGSPTYSGPLTLTDTTTVKFRSWDTHGNAEQVRSQEIKLDAVAPTAAITAPADGSDQVGSVNVDVDASDAGSGIADVQLFVDGDYLATSSSTASPYSFTLAAGSLAFGTHKLKAIATDKLGNNAGSALITITLKDGVPSTTIACDGGACPAGFVKDPVSVTLVAGDGGSGVDATRYTLDGSDPSETSALYSGPFTVSETTTVKFRSWSSTGNAEPVREQTIKIDATAPTAQVTAPAEGVNVVGDVHVSANVADAGVGLADVELFLDGDFVAISGATSSPYDFTLAAGTIPLGTHRVKIIATDKLGNRVSSDTVTFTLTHGLPTTTIACDSLTCSSDWKKGPVEVSLAATDSGNGVGATRYTLDGSDPDTGSTEYTGPFTLTEATTVKFRSYDSDGNAEQVRSQEIKLDAVAPSAAISSPADGSDQVGSVNVEVAASDAGSGIADVQLFVDGDYVDTSSSTTSPYSFTLAAGSLSFGTHKLKAIATDKLGNTTGSALVTVTLKNGVPMTTIACDGGTCPVGFVKNPVSVTLAAIDGGSGVGATRYTLDGTDPDETSAEYTGPFTVSETTTVKFRSWSSAGDVEPVHEQTIKIDSTGPTAQVTSPTEGTEVEGDVIVNVDASDAGSGIGEVSLFIDGDYVDSSASTSSPFTFTWHTGDYLPGAHRVKAIVADKLDNRTSTSTVNVTIKTPPPPPGPPTTTISCDGLGCPTGFVKDPIVVTLATIDGGAGVGPTRYTLDGADPDETSTEYTGPFTVSETTTVKFRSWSPSGDIEDVRSQTLKIDSTPPTAQILSPTAGQTITGDLVVTAEAADAGIGIASVDLYVDGDYAGFSSSPVSPYEITLPAGTLAPGTHRIKVEATDKLGNSFRTEQVLVEVADPAI